MKNKGKWYHVVVDYIMHVMLHRDEPDLNQQHCHIMRHAHSDFQPLKIGR